MTESIKIVDTSSVDKNEELRGLIPESTYYHSTGITQRVHSRFGPYEGNLVGDNASSSRGTQYNWQLAANPNASVDLNEGFFEIRGNLRVKCSVSDSNLNGHELHIKTEDLLIPSDLWFHSFFNNVQLRVGDAVISNVLNPVVHNVFRRLMFHGKQKSPFTGFAGTHVFPEGDALKSSKQFYTDIGAQASKEEVVTPVDIHAYHGGLYNFANPSSILPLLLRFDASHKEILVPFSCKMMLQDLFDTDDLIPIFNQNIKISLQRSSDEALSIQCASPDFSVELANFDYFQLNMFSYLLEESNKKMLMNIYSKPRAVVFGTRQQVFQTVTSVGTGGQVTINSPTGLLFGAKFLMMYNTKNNTNVVTPINFSPNTVAGEKGLNISSGLLIDKVSSQLSGDVQLLRKKITNLTAARFPVYAMGPHTAYPIDYRICNIECGGYKVLYDDVGPLITKKVDRQPGQSAIIEPTVYKDLNYQIVDDNGDEENPIRTEQAVCWYTRLYHEYCESCIHTGIEPVSHEEFINCWPVIMVELSDFSRIATNSFLNINFQNGDYANITGRTPYTIDNNDHTQLNIICYGLRALQMSNGFSRLMEVDNTVTNSDMDDVIEVQ